MPETNSNNKLKDGTTLAVGAPYEDSGAVSINGDQADNSTINSGAVYIFSRKNKVWEQEAYFKASNSAADYGFGGSLSLSHDGKRLAVGSSGESSGSSGINGNKFGPTAWESGAVYIYTKSQETWSEEAYLKASNAEVWDRFGYLAMSGDGKTLSVSATREASNAAGINGDQSDNSLAESGAVYIFARADGVWSQQAYLKAAVPKSSARFGYGLAVSFNGNTVAVGSTRDEALDTTDPTDSSVHVFVRDADTWRQQAYLRSSNTQPHNRGIDFGGSLALSNDGNVLAVGAGAERIGGESFSGGVYIFTRSVNSWTQQANILPPNPMLHGAFGYAVDISGDGNKLVVGARGEGSNALGVNENQYNELAYSRGVAYVYTRSFGSWHKTASLNPSHAEAGLSFGNTVAISAEGSDIAVGSYKESSASTGVNDDKSHILSRPESGAVFLY